MKRMIAFVLCLALATVCCVAAGEGTQETKNPYDFAFEPNGEGTAVITGVWPGWDPDSSGYAPSVSPVSVTIPREVRGYTVTELSLFNFEGVGIGYRDGSSPGSSHPLESTRQITLPDTLRRIDTYCFAYCRSLREIVIPEGVEEIGDYAFFGCEKLSSVTFPSTLRRIGKQAFLKCESLTSVVLPEGLEEIGEEAFMSCEALAEVDLEGNNVRIGRDAFVLTPVREKMEGRDAGGDTEIIGDRFTVVRKDGRVILTSVNEDGPFQENIDIPEGITGMDFSTQTLYRLGGQHVRIPASMTEDFRFEKGVPHDIYWVVAEGNPRYRAADGMLIDETRHTVISGVQSGKVVIPEGVEIIGEHAFDYCRVNELVLPESLREIGAYAFYQNDGLSSVSFPASLEKIHASAFLYTQVKVLPPCVLKLESEPHLLERRDGIDSRDGKWKYILFTDDSCAITGFNPPEKAKGTLAIPDRIDGHPVAAVLFTVSYCYLYDSLKIPEGVRLLAKNAFNNFTILKVQLPKSLEEVHPDAFHLCYKLEFADQQAARFPDANPNKAPFAYRIMADGTVRVIKWKNSGTKTAEIPGEVEGRPVTSIGPGAFREVKAETVIIPDSVRIIGCQAFSRCGSLKKVVLPEGLEYIGAEAFIRCTNLSDITFPSGLTYLGDNAFIRVPVKKAILPEGLKYLGAAAFRGGGECTKVYLPGTLEYVGPLAFQFQEKLKDVTVAEGIRKIGSGTFASCGITKLVLPQSLKTLEEGAFARCESLQSVDASGCEYIGEEAFAFCPKLKSLVLGENLQHMMNGAFLDHGLKEITLPASVQTVGDSALFPMNTKGALKVTLKGEIPGMSKYAFAAMGSGKGKLVWPAKLTLQYPASADSTAGILKEFMSENGIKENAWKLVRTDP